MEDDSNLDPEKHSYDTRIQCHIALDVYDGGRDSGSYFQDCGEIRTERGDQFQTVERSLPDG